MNTATATVRLYRFTFAHRIPVQVWAGTATEAQALVRDDAERFTITGMEVR